MPQYKKRHGIIGTNVRSYKKSGNQPWAFSCNRQAPEVFAICPRCGARHFVHDASQLNARGVSKQQCHGCDVEDADARKADDISGAVGKFFTAPPGKVRFAYNGKGVTAERKSGPWEDLTRAEFIAPGRYKIVAHEGRGDTSVYIVTKGAGERFLKVLAAHAHRRLEESTSTLPKWASDAGYLISTREGEAGPGAKVFPMVFSAGLCAEAATNIPFYSSCVDWPDRYRDALGWLTHNYDEIPRSRFVDRVADDAELPPESERYADYCIVDGFPDVLFFRMSGIEHVFARERDIERMSRHAITNEVALIVEPNPSPYKWDTYAAFGHAKGGGIWSMTRDGEVSRYTATNSREKHNSKKVRAAGVSAAGPGGNAQWSGRYEPSTKRLTMYSIVPHAEPFTKFHLNRLAKAFPEALYLMPFVVTGGFGPGVMEATVSEERAPRPADGWWYHATKLSNAKKIAREGMKTGFARQVAKTYGQASPGAKVNTDLVLQQAASSTTNKYTGNFGRESIGRIYFSNATKLGSDYYGGIIARKHKERTGKALKMATLRVAHDDVKMQLDMESRADGFVTATVPASKIQMLDSDGEWKPIRAVLSESVVDRIEKALESLMDVPKIISD